MSKSKKPPRAAKPRPRPAALAVDPLRDLEVAARGVEGARPMIDLPTVRCVQTIFPGLDRAIGLPGWPLGTISLVHGPPSDGKSTLAVGLGISFQRANGIFDYVDAELAADLKFYEQLGLKIDAALITKPRTYEEVMEHYNKLLTTVRAGLAPNAKKEKRFSHAGITFLSVLDSATKAMPEEILEKFGKDQQAVREAGRLQAAWNKHFVGVVNPLMHGLPVAVIVIVHEGEGEKKGKYAPIQMRGGKALQFEARVRLRVKRIGFEKVGEVKVAQIAAVTVWKNKLGGSGGETRIFTATPDGLERGVPQLDLERHLYGAAEDAGLVRQRLEGAGMAKKKAGIEIGGEEEADRAAWLRRLADPAEHARVAALVRAVPIGQGRGTRRRADDEAGVPEEKPARGAELLPPAAAGGGA